jgi:hypothetical protein
MTNLGGGWVLIGKGRQSSDSSDGRPVVRRHEGFKTVQRVTPFSSCNYGHDSVAPLT